LKTILHSLPDASPVYSQWWFKEKVYTDLVNILLNYSKPRDRVAFLGAPTIGTFFSHFSQNRQCNILDIDEFVLKELSLQSPAKTEYIPYDATNPLNPELHKRFKLIFSDPPWSSKLLKTFFHRSCQMVAPEGKVLISFPQEFTRPTATEERFELINTAANHGFSLATIHHNFTEYSIPEFEFNAYKKKGIHLENTWRKGDLFVFVKNRSSDKPIEFENQTHQTYWQQFDLGKKRFFLKRDGKEEKGLPDIRKVPDLTSFAYPSTSSRSTAWRNASLVSTQNTIARAFGRSHLEMYFKNITQICKHKNLTNINVNLGETRNDVFIKLLDFLKNKRE
jgi:hypothetical protein